MRAHQSDKTTYGNDVFRDYQCTNQDLHFSMYGFYPPCIKIFCWKYFCVDSGYYDNYYRSFFELTIHNIPSPSYHYSSFEFSRNVREVLNTENLLVIKSSHHETQRLGFSRLPPELSTKFFVSYLIFTY